MLNYAFAQRLSRPCIIYQPKAVAFLRDDANISSFAALLCGGFGLKSLFVSYHSSFKIPSTQ
jgi:hypothetical protein